MRTFKIYSFSNFQICHTVLLTIVAIGLHPHDLLYHWKFDLFTSFTHFPNPSPTFNLLSQTVIPGRISKLTSISI